jgi:hypothetical protein
MKATFIAIVMLFSAVLIPADLKSLQKNKDAALGKLMRLLNKY